MQKKSVAWLLFTDGVHWSEWDLLALLSMKVLFWNHHPEVILDRHLQQDGGVREEDFNVPSQCNMLQFEGTLSFLSLLYTMNTLWKKCLHLACLAVKMSKRRKHENRTLKWLFDLNSTCWVVKTITYINRGRLYVLNQIAFFLVGRYFNV